MKLAIVGAQVGDEGKGRVVHHISTQYRYICRTSGSENCGHSVWVEGKKLVYHYLPSIDFRSTNTIGYLGAGMVINPANLLAEIKGFLPLYPNAAKQIIIDPYCFLIDQRHVDEDKAKNQHIGTTNKGVGPAYTEKIGRKGKRIIDLENDSSIEEMKSLGVKFIPSYSMLDSFKNNNVLFEGAQGVLLDVNNGTYPFVTSTDCLPTSLGSSGFASIKVDEVLGVAKPYVTKVGTGPFPTEFFGEEAGVLVAAGNEFGSTTGRKRRVGALDLVALKYAVEVAGITQLCLTKLDVLDGIDRIKVAVAYRNPLKGPQDFFTAEPIYEEIKGWERAKDFGKELTSLISMIQMVVGVPVTAVSYGVSERDIKMQRVFK